MYLYFSVGMYITTVLSYFDSCLYWYLAYIRKGISDRVYTSQWRLCTREIGASHLSLRTWQNSWYRPASTLRSGLSSMASRRTIIIFSPIWSATIWRRYCDIYTRSEIPLRICAKHQYRQESEYGSTLIIYNPAIRTPVHSYHKAWYNISRIYDH